MVHFSSQPAVKVALCILSHIQSEASPATLFQRLFQKTNMHGNGCNAKLEVFHATLGLLWALDGWRKYFSPCQLRSSSPP